jgi:hypothetical protein
MSLFLERPALVSIVLVSDLFVSFAYLLSWGKVLLTRSSPIYSLTLPIFINSANDEHCQMSHCFKIMLEAGADLSLKASAYSSRNTIFYLGMLCGSLVGDASMST